MVLSSCFIFKRDGKGTSGENITSTRLPDTTKVPVIYDTVPATKDLGVQIAVMLPFFLDSVDVYAMDDEGPSIYPEALRALGFYEGILTALDSLKNKGANLVVHVYDTHNDTAKVKKILSGPEFDNMDLIIGPVYNRNLRLTAEFAKKNEIYLFAPLSPSNSITYFNPYYIMMNATLDTHCRKLGEYINKKYSETNIVLIYQENPLETERVEHFSTIINNRNFKRLSITKQFVKPKDIAPLLSDSVPNTVVIPSFDEAFVSYIFHQLNPLLKKHEIVVFGMPTWNSYESLRSTYLQDLQVHITDSYWLDKEDERTIRFKKDYQKRFNCNPSQYAFRGYEIMTYIGHLVTTYGLGFADAFTTTTFKTAFSEFALAPNYVNKYDTSSTSKIDFYENQSVHILKYKDFSLLKVDR